jgi:hypothetical protein
VRRHQSRIVFIRIFPLRREQDRDGGLEFADRFRVAAGKSIADRQHAAGHRRIEAFLANAGSLPFHHVLRGGNPGFDLA